MLSKLLHKFYSCIFYDNRNNKESVANNRKQKAETIKLLCLLKVKSKLNSIEILIYQALIGLEISHKEFKTIVNEKRKV